MTTLLKSVRRKILGETRAIPLGVAATILLAYLTRGLLPHGEWQTAGAFALAAAMIADGPLASPLCARGIGSVRSRSSSWNTRMLPVRPSSTSGTHSTRPTHRCSCCSSQRQRRPPPMLRAVVFAMTSGGSSAIAQVSAHWRSRL